MRVRKEGPRKTRGDVRSGSPQTIEAVIVYIAATYAHSHWVFDAMDIYLAGNNGKGRIIDTTFVETKDPAVEPVTIAKEVMILESYVYARSSKHMMRLI